MNDLKNIRNQIDELDQQLLALLSQRAELALAVAAVKVAEEGEKAEFYRPEREAQVLKNIIHQNKGPLSTKAVTEIFRMIMTQCRQLEIEKKS